jgi:transposase
MSLIPAELPDDPRQLQEIIVKLHTHYEKENDLLREQIRVLFARLYGKKSEKKIVSAAVPLPLFDMPEPEIEPEAEKVEVPGHTRKKSGRKKLPDSLPRVEVIHDIAEEDKTCGCGNQKKCVGQETQEKLDYIPAVLRVVKIVRLKYACEACEGLETQGPVVQIAPVPPQIIPKGIATAGLLAHVICAKFCDALPFYRQEKQFCRLGVDLGRTTMCNWAMQVAETCQPLLELVKEHIRSGPLINMDETTVQVLQEPGRPASSKSYMWMCRGGPPDKPALLYHYAPTRSSQVAESLLLGYRGIVQTDGYGGYDFLRKWENIIHAGCWAHARRKFTDTAKGLGKDRKPGSVDVALGYIRRLYEVEAEGKKKEYDPQQMVALRQEKATPILDDFFLWLSKKSLQVVPKSLMGIAVNYTLKQWPSLLLYLDHGHLTPDNNLAENAIRPFVVGRKNWLFAGTPEGASASACLYSLIETAKANGLEPYRYLRFLFEKLPLAATREDLIALLPMHLLPQDLVLPDVVTGV